MPVMVSASATRVITAGLRFVSFYVAAPIGLRLHRFPSSPSLSARALRYGGTSMRRISLLLVLLFAVTLGAGRWLLMSAEREAEQVTGLRVPAAPSPTPAASAVPASPLASASPAEEVEPGDAEPMLDKLLPRRSAGHAAGLNKVPDPLTLDSSVALVIDAGSQQVKLSKNQDAVLPIASLTKLMTGLVIAEAGLPMNEPITITDDDVDVERHSRSRLKVGTTLTRAEALRLALMSSENRAAHALGRTHPGGLQRFVAAMNARARALGMPHTTYVDPTGLSASNQSSARDLAALVVAASGHPLLREYSTTPLYRAAVGTRTLQYINSNRLVRSGHWDIALQKTGYIIEAGHCAVMRTRIGERDWVMVLLDAGGNVNRSNDAERIRRWIDPSAEPTPQAHAPMGKRTKAAAEGKRVRRSFGRPQP